MLLNMEYLIFILRHSNTEDVVLYINYSFARDDKSFKIVTIIRVLCIKYRTKLIAKLSNSIQTVANHLRPNRLNY